MSKLKFNQFFSRRFLARLRILFRCEICDGIVTNRKLTLTASNLPPKGKALLVSEKGRKKRLVQFAGTRIMAGSPLGE